MKPILALKGAALALCLNLSASDDVLKLTADQGHVYVMESGDVYYSHTADFAEKVKIGTSDLEIYEMDGLVEPEEGRKYLGTSHPAGIFYPCEMKKEIPQSRGFYHVSMDNGLDRLVFLDERVSMIVAQKRTEHKVISVFEDFSLLTDGLIYEGWDDLVGGEVVQIEDETFDYGADRYNAVGEITEEREVVSHYTVTGECDQLEDTIKVALTQLDRDCPIIWFGQYKDQYDTAQKRVLIAKGGDGELFYLDPATFQMMASNMAFFRRDKREVKEIISNDGEEVVFDDGSKVQLKMDIQKIIEGLTCTVDGETIGIDHTSKGDLQGSIDFSQTTDDASFQGHIEYDFQEQPKFTMTYERQDAQGSCTGTMGVTQTDLTSGTGVFTMDSGGELLHIDAKYSVTDVFAIDLFITHPTVGDGVNVKITFQPDFMELLNPTSMDEGKKVFKSHFIMDEELRKNMGLDFFFFDVYSECNK